MPASNVPALSSIPQSQRLPSRSTDSAGRKSGISRSGFKLTLCSAGRRVQRYLAQLCDRIRKPYRGRRADGFNPAGYVPGISIVSAPPAPVTAALSNFDIHKKFNSPSGDCVANNVRFLENKLRAKERERDLQPGQPRLISELLSEWTGGHPFFVEREKSLAKIKDETAETISQYLALEGDGGRSLIVMTKEIVAQKIEGIFVRSQIEFLARVLAYGNHADALTMHRRAHFETRPLSVDGFPSTRYPNTIGRAQTKLFERLFAMGVEQMGGRKPAAIPSREMARLVQEYFQKETIGAMREFVAENPGYAKIRGMTPTQTIRDFETRLKSRLGQLAGCTDYINDGMAAALQWALLRKVNPSPSEKLIFKKLDFKVNPAVLLTRASERAGERILRREVRRMLDAAEAAGTAKKRPGAAIRVKSPAVQQNPPKHHKNGHQIR